MCKRIGVLILNESSLIGGDYDDPGHLLNKHFDCFACTCSEVERLIVYMCIFVYNKKRHDWIASRLNGIEQDKLK